MKKILIVTRAFYPDQTPRSFRATELAKEFCRQGHNVTVVAPHKDNMQPLLDEFPIHYISLGQLRWKTPNIKGLGRMGALFNKTVDRSLPLFLAFPDMEMFFKVRKMMRKESENYDVLISSAVPYPVHWGVASVWSKHKEKNKARIWVADCGDPYCLQENDTFRPPFYFKWVENWFMRKVDFITVPTENSCNGYFPEFHSKLKIIPQGFRFEDITKKPLLNDGIIRFGYGGAFIQGRRDPRELLEFLVSLDKSIYFEFFIYTRSGLLVESYAKKDSRIKLMPPIPRSVLLETFSTFNFVVNFGNVGTAQTPSKLIDYAIIEKPILHIETGNLDKEAVVQFLESNYDKQLRIVDSNRFRIERVADEFLKLS